MIGPSGGIKISSQFILSKVSCYGQRWCKSLQKSTRGSQASPISPPFPPKKLTHEEDDKTQPRSCDPMCNYGSVYKLKMHMINSPCFYRQKLHQALTKVSFLLLQVSSSGGTHLESNGIQTVVQSELLHSTSSSLSAQRRFS